MALEIVREAAHPRAARFTASSVLPSRPDWVDCGNWAPSAVCAVPGSATSGIYFAKLVR